MSMVRGAMMCAPGVLVAAWVVPIERENGDQPYARTHSAEDGSFRVAVPAEREIELRATPWGDAAPPQPVRVRAGGGEVVVRLDTTPPTLVTVVEASGAPI